MRFIALSLIGFLWSCALPKTQGLDTSAHTYRHQIELEVWVDGKSVPPPDGRRFDGYAVVPYGHLYNFKIRHSAKMDKVFLTTCHREIEENRAGKSERFPYMPKANERLCDLKIAAYNMDGGEHGFAYVSFENDEYKLPFISECNGGQPIEFRGVGICQSKAGLIQYLKFSEPVDMVSERICEKHDLQCLALPKSCARFSTKNGLDYEYTIEYGRCRIMFLSFEGEDRVGKFTTIGYDRPIIKGL